MELPVPVVVATIVMLAAAVVCVLIRLARGPTLIDRVIAVDVLMAIIVCGLGVHAAATGDRTYVPVLLALSLLAFIASVSVARFGPVQDHRPLEHPHDTYTHQLPKVQRKRGTDA